MKFFFDRYKQLGELPAHVKLPTTIRVNTKKVTKKQLIKRLHSRNIQTKKVPFLQDGINLKSSFSVGATVEYLLGLYYIQEAAAQVPVQVLMKGAKHSDLILDMCAAPGGKTTQIAQYTNGQVVALDIKQSRLDALKNNIERLNLPNISTFNLDGRKATSLNLKFDRILLDAPCAGNFTTDKLWFKKRNISGIRKQAKLQQELLKSAYKVLKKGGVLIYSTCSLEPEENELNIEKFLKTHQDMKLEKINLEIGSPALTEVFGKRLTSTMKKAVRFWPWKTQTEGFFIAKLRK